MAGSERANGVTSADRYGIEILFDPFPEPHRFQPDGAAGPIDRTGQDSPTAGSTLNRAVTRAGKPMVRLTSLKGLRQAGPRRAAGSSCGAANRRSAMSRA